VRLRCTRREKGIALAVVVWFLAGMSLLVAGIVMSARTDTRLAQVHYARAQVTAAGDGAINLLLADMQDRVLQGEGGVLPQARYQVGDDWVAVHAVPAEALVDVSSATLAELVAVARAARLPGDEAQGLARAVIQYRDSPTRRVRLDSMEDLLGARGMNRAALDALRDFITVSPLGTRRAARPRAERGSSADESRAQARVGVIRGWSPAARAADAELRAVGGLPGGGDAAAARLLRVDALVRRDRDVWLRRRWVKPGRGKAGLPWGFQRTEPVRMVPRP